MKKITTTGSSASFLSPDSNGQGSYNHPRPIDICSVPLVIFLTFFEKNYNNWIKCKLPKFQIKWTGLQWNLDFWFAKKDFTPLCFQKKLNWMPLHLDRGGCCGAKYIWWKIMSLNPDLVSTVAIIFAHPRTNQEYSRFLGWAQKLHGVPHLRYFSAIYI